MARGYSRCSGCTPTVCVGTRANRRGWAGAGAALGAGQGRAVCPVPVEVRAPVHEFRRMVLAGQDQMELDVSSRLITPLRDATFVTVTRTGLKAALRPKKLNCEPDFLEFPRPHLCGVER